MIKFENLYIDYGLHNPKHHILIFCFRHLHYILHILFMFSRTYFKFQLLTKILHIIWYLIVKRIQIEYLVFAIYGQNIYCNLDVTVIWIIFRLELSILIIYSNLKATQNVFFALDAQKCKVAHVDKTDKKRTHPRRKMMQEKQRIMCMI